MADMKIGVVGAAGRMGRMVIRAATEAEGCALGAAIEVEGSDDVGRDAGELAGVGALGVEIGTDARAMFEAVDAVIEFSLPMPTIHHARLAAQTGTAHVVGTTGLDREQEAILAEAGKDAPIVFAPNMSLGVNLLLALTERVAASLGEEWDIEILEMHHRMKVDAPSGTALGLGRAAAAGRGVDHEAKKRAVRDGHTGARERGTIGYATLRGGDVVGEHTVIFAGDGERVELSHKAGGRHVFAQGAVRAALWTRGKGPGLYTMKDVLGI